MPSAEKLADEKKDNPADNEAAKSVLPSLTLTFTKSETKITQLRKDYGRAPNPFDAIVKQSFDEKQPYEFPFPHQPGGDLEKEKEAIYGLLRNAAKFHLVGLDIRIKNDTSDEKRAVWFSARPVKEVKRRK